MKNRASKTRSVKHPAASYWGPALVAAAFFASMAAPSTALAAGQKVAIILQENTGHLDVFDELPQPVQNVVEAVVDGLAETFESIRTTLVANERYDRVINLTDANCTRAKLLERLKQETAANNSIDLFVYGHGSDELLQLHGSGVLTGTASGNVRSMLTEAHLARFNLRLVYMCNCFGSTLNDDWLAVGAKTAIGATGVNMPEPQIGNFLNNFIDDNMPAAVAANAAYASSLPFWFALPQSMVNSSRPVVLGDSGLRHTDTRLSVNEARQFTVRADRTHNFIHLFGKVGEKYKFTASGNDTWGNGSTVTGPAGYTPTLFDLARRHADSGYNEMMLVGEIFNRDNDVGAYSGRYFKIGTSATRAMTTDGYFVLFANDMLTSYGDNAGSLRVTVTRTQ